MKTILKIAVVSFFLFASCQKSVDQPYTLKFYGDAYEDIGYSATIVSDGYVFAGEVTDVTRSGGSIISQTKDMGIFKTGWDGNVIWKVTAGGKYDDWGTKINQLDDQSLICVGTFTDTTAATPGTTDIFIVKVTSAGIIEWQKHYGGAGNQTGKDVVKSANGFLILGSTDIARGTVGDSLGNTAGNKDVFLLNISNAGDSLGTFTWGYAGNDIGTVIKPDQGGGFIIYGTTDKSDPGQANNNLWLLKLNSAGYLTQSKIVGGTEDEYAGDMEVLEDGYLLAYTVGKDGINQSAYVKKLPSNIYAAPLFTNKIKIVNPLNTADSSTCVNAMTKYSTNSFLLAGQSGIGTAGKMLIFEIDATGNPVAGRQMIKGSTGTQIAYDVVSGDDGYIIAVGENSYDVNSMITFLKFKF
jgi:hypothetical protein